MLATGDGYTPVRRCALLLSPRAQDVEPFTADASGRISPWPLHPRGYPAPAPAGLLGGVTGVTSHFVRNTPLTVVSAVFAGGLPSAGGIATASVILFRSVCAIFTSRRIDRGCLSCRLQA
jgi:hypothetical protein